MRREETKNNRRNLREKERNEMKKEDKIGNRIRLIRKKLKLRQKEFAEELEIGVTTLSEIENNNYYPNYRLIKNLSARFNVNLYHLFFGEGEMFTDSTSAFLGSTESFAVNIEEVRQFLFYFERSPIVQYLILGNFRSILRKEKEIIEKEVEEFKSKKQQ
jgi:transcriptional regulator with XRE-family HTH domain